MWRGREGAAHGGSSSRREAWHSGVRAPEQPST